MKLNKNKCIRKVMRTKYLASTILLLLQFFFQPSYANQKDTLTLTILPSNNDFSAIQNALNNKADAVLKIILKGNFYVDKTLETTRQNTLLQFTPGSSLHLLNKNSGGIVIAHNDCTVKGGTIIGNGISTTNFYKGFGILLSGVNNCTVQNMSFTKISGIAVFLSLAGNKGCNEDQVLDNRITNSVMDLGGKGDEAGILLGYSGNGYFHRNNVIKGNYVDGNNILKIGIGIIGHGDGNSFLNNQVYNCRSYGIISYESTYTDVSLHRTYIIDNTIKNIGEVGARKTVKGMGIYLQKSMNSIVKGNKIYNTLRNSDQTESLGAGSISISGSVNTIVDDNFIDGSFMYGFTNDYSFGSTFTNNTVENIRKSGAYFMNVNNVKVANNTFRSIGEVVFKGYFQNTSLKSIKAQWKIDTYLNLTTGQNILIEDNKIYKPKDILYFTGSKPLNGESGNKIKNNNFKNNTIYGISKKIPEMVNYREDVINSNRISNNTIKNN